jgi:hypothetical protein
LAPNKHRCSHPLPALSAGKQGPGWLRRGEVWGLLHRDAACAGPRGEVSGGSTQVPHHDPVKQGFEYGT